MISTQIDNLHTKIQIRDDITTKFRVLEKYRTMLEIKGMMINIVMKHPEIQ